MSLMSIANELVAGCREGRTMENLDKLYAPDAVSVEAADMGQGRQTKGVAGIKAKHEWWEGAMEILDGDIKGPMPDGDNRFAVIFSMTVKERATGKVSEMEEVAVYTVEDDKITREEFFYAPE